jgi:hypothetical protein
VRLEEHLVHAAIRTNKLLLAVWEVQAPIYKRSVGCVGHGVLGGAALTHGENLPKDAYSFDAICERAKDDHFFGEETLVKLFERTWLRDLLRILVSVTFNQGVTSTSWRRYPTHIIHFFTRKRDSAKNAPELEMILLMESSEEPIKKVQFPPGSSPTLGENTPSLSIVPRTVGKVPQVHSDI